jgi:hypothetical protein
VKDHPVSAAGIIGAPYLAMEILRQKAVSEGRITQDSADRLKREQPLSAVLPAGDRGVSIMAVGRFMPTEESAEGFLSSGFAMGIGTQLAARLAFSQGDAKRGVMPDALGGWPSRLHIEEATPGAAIPRIFSETLGGPYSGTGRFMTTGMKAAIGEKDYYGRPYSWEDAIIKWSTGLTLQNADPETVPDIIPGMSGFKPLPDSMIFGGQDYGAKEDRLRQRGAERSVDKKTGGIIPR